MDVARAAVNAFGGELAGAEETVAYGSVPGLGSFHFLFRVLPQGCVCPIGSIQNVTLAMTDHSYILPLTVLIFFLAPLVFTLLFGRTFCAGVCPFGALQDMVSFKAHAHGARA